MEFHHIFVLHPNEKYSSWVGNMDITLFRALLTLQKMGANDLISDGTEVIISTGPVSDRGEAVPLRDVLSLTYDKEMISWVDKSSREPLSALIKKAEQDFLAARNAFLDRARKDNPFIDEMLSVFTPCYAHQRIVFDAFYEGWLRFNDLRLAFRVTLAQVAELLPRHSGSPY